MALWLVPVNDESFRGTLESPVDLREWDERPLDFPLFARVLGINTDTAQDARERNRRYWGLMESGDPLLVYHTDEDRYVAVGRVGQKAETAHFCERYWDERSATSVFTVDDYDDSVDLDREAVNEVLGYDDGFRPLGLSKVGSGRPIGELEFVVDVIRQRVHS